MNKQKYQVNKLERCLKTVLKKKQKERNEQNFCMFRKCANLVFPMEAGVDDGLTPGQIVHQSCFCAEKAGSKIKESDSKDSIDYSLKRHLSLWKRTSQSQSKQKMIKNEPKQLKIGNAIKEKNNTMNTI